MRVTKSSESDFPDMYRTYRGCKMYTHFCRQSWSEKTTWEI